MQNLWISNLIQWIYLESRTRGHDDDDLNSLHCVEFSSTAWKVSKYGVNLRIESKYGKLRTRKTPYLNKFCAVQNNTGFPWSTNLQSKNANFFILIVWYLRTHQQKKKYNHGFLWPIIFSCPYGEHMGQRKLVFRHILGSVVLFGMVDRRKSVNIFMREVSFIKKPVHWSIQQINCLVSIW